MWKDLPILGYETVNIRAKYKEDHDTIEKLEVTSCAIRERLIEEGKWDEMSLRQPTYTPTLKPNDIIQVVFRYVNDNNSKEDYEW